MKFPFCRHLRNDGGFRRRGFLPILGIGIILSLSAAQLQAQNRFQIGSGSWHETSLWSTGAVPVSGQEVYIGNSTPRTATISAGNAESGAASIAYNSGETGGVTVKDTRTWNIGGYVYVGASGTGTLRVQDGGEVLNTSGLIGTFTNSYGAVTVTGTGSLWQNSAHFIVGNSGNGTLDVENGGKVTTSSFATVGNAGRGVTTVTGTGSSLEAATAMRIGVSGTGTLNIEAGGKVSSGTQYEYTFLGYSNKGSGEATVTGENSLFEVKGYLAVGYSGQGTLNVQNGGKVTTSYQAYLGRESGSQGMATVTGSNSQWTISDLLRVGYSGKGTLNIEAGGKVVSTKTSTLASVAGSIGEATVTGSHSLWQNLAGLDVGSSGDATLNVRAGGRVTVAGENTYIGYSDGSSGAVTVTGSGSLMENSGALWISYWGAGGSLDVADGGKVTATSVNLGLGADSKGIVTLSGSAGSRGTLETAYLSKGGAASRMHLDGGLLRATGAQSNFLRSFGAGEVLIHEGGAFIDTNGFDVTVATDLQNAAPEEEGGLTKQGAGRLTLTGTSTYSGATTVEQGSLRVTGNLASGVTLQTGAMLDGTGTVGAVTVENGGIIAPGNSVGTLSTGNQTWNGGGTYLWEINSVTGTPGAEWDLLNVDGKLMLASTLEDPFFIALKGDLTGLNPQGIYEWTILTASEGFDVSFNTDKIAFTLAQFHGLTDEMSLSLSIQDDDLVLTLAVVPEPGQTALFLITVATGWVWHRRKRVAV